MNSEEKRTVWCGNLAEQVTEEILYELFLQVGPLYKPVWNLHLNIFSRITEDLNLGQQAGPLEKVRIAKDRDGRCKTFAFITFCHEASVPYALTLFRGTSLYHKTLSLKTKSTSTLLAPPIRCTGPDPNVDFRSQEDVMQDFVSMTERLRDEETFKHIGLPAPEPMDNLVLASLQGNWSHRHHPYHSDKPQARDQYRSRDNHNDNYRNKHSNNWRDRRNHKKSYGHRREWWTDVQYYHSVKKLYFKCAFA